MMSQASWQHLSCRHVGFLEWDVVKITSWRCYDDIHRNWKKFIMEKMEAVTTLTQTTCLVWGHGCDPDLQVTEEPGGRGQEVRHRNGAEMCALFKIKAPPITPKCCCWKLRHRRVCCWRGCFTEFCNKGGDYCDPLMNKSQRTQRKNTRGLVFVCTADIYRANRKHGGTDHL